MPPPFFCAATAPPDQLFRIWLIMLFSTLPNKPPTNCSPLAEATDQLFSHFGVPISPDQAADPKIAARAEPADQFKATAPPEMMLPIKPPTFSLPVTAAIDQFLLMDVPE